MFVYDEGFNYIAAYEWAERNHYFIDFDAHTPLKNTKPYLFIYLQGLLGELTNWNLFFIRLPTLLSFVLITWMGCYIIRQKLQRYNWACLSIVLPVLAPYWLMPHLNFTGDHDVPLTLFLLAYLWFLFLVIENDSILIPKNKTAIWIPICAALSVLTKGWVIFFFLPSGLFYLWYRKKLALFQNIYLWLGIAISLTLLVSWYWGREMIDPGYLETVWKYEINRIAQKRGEVHPEFIYYWKLILVDQLGWISVGLIFTMYNYFQEKNRLVQRTLFFITIHVLVFISLFSFSKVKLDWYTYPVLPLLIILTAYGWDCFWEKLCSFNNSTKWIVVGLCSIVVVYAYTHAFMKTFPRFNKDAFYILEQDSIWNTHGKILYTDFNPSLIYYSRKMGREDSTLISGSSNSIIIGDTLIFSERLLGTGIQRVYETEKMDQIGNCTVLKIKGVKQ